MTNVDKVLARNLTANPIDLIVELTGDALLLTIRPCEGRWIGTMEPGGAIEWSEREPDHKGREPDGR